MTTIIPKFNGGDESFENNESVVLRFAEAFVGRGNSEDKARVVDNITSIQKAVIDGKHDTVFYPSCGVDAVRVALAYKPKELIAVDTDPQVSLIIKQLLNNIDILYTEELIEDANTTKLTLNNGCTINLIESDSVQEANKIDGKVDVLHIYCPQTEDYETIVRPLLNKLSIEKVNVDGYIVYGEDKFIENKIVSKKLLSLLGLEEIEIISRHPETVNTYHTVEDLEIGLMDKTGYIYHKTREATQEEMDCAFKFFDIVTGAFIVVNKFKKEEVTFGKSEGEETTAKKSVINLFNYAIEESDKLRKEFENIIGIESLNEIKNTILIQTIESLIEIQNLHKESISVFNREVEKYNNNEIMEEELKNNLGLKNNQFGKLESDKYPIMSLLFSFDGEDSEKSSQIKSIVEFTKIDLEEIRKEFRF